MRCVHWKYTSFPLKETTERTHPECFSIRHRSMITTRRLRMAVYSNGYCAYVYVCMCTLYRFIPFIIIHYNKDIHTTEIDISSTKKLRGVHLRIISFFLFYFVFFLSRCIALLARDITVVSKAKRVYVAFYVTRAIDVRMTNDKIVLKREKNRGLRYTCARC